MLKGAAEHWRQRGRGRNCDVDDQFAPLAGKIKEALKGIADKPVKLS